LAFALVGVQLVEVLAHQVLQAERDVALLDVPRGALLVFAVYLAVVDLRVVLLRRREVRVGRDLRRVRLVLAGHLLGVRAGGVRVVHLVLPALVVVTRAGATLLALALVAALLAGILRRLPALLVSLLAVLLARLLAAARHL